MEGIVNIHVEALDEGGYLATSDDVQGLVAQGRTIQETLEIAKDVIRKLQEAQAGQKAAISMKKISNSFDYPLVIGL
jgi:predicted RNase H-like HicB family nuclease